MQTPSSPGDVGRDPAPQLTRPTLRQPEGVWLVSDTLTWLSGLILACSTLMGWYSGSSVQASGSKLVLTVTGWNTGLIGQIVFFLGLAILVLVLLRTFGIALPASLPESLIVIAIGAAATVLVLIRLIWIPDRFLPADGRWIGIWIALASGLAVIVAGLLEAREEL